MRYATAKWYRAEVAAHARAVAAPYPPAVSEALTHVPYYSVNRQNEPVEYRDVKALAEDRR